MTPPDVQVVRGAPDDDELAALVAGLAANAANGHDQARGHDHEEAARSGHRRWRDGAERLAPLTPGPDAWRWSTLR
ncbi:acyl-CoA carboxylase epsilon subunit [Actinotalea sp. K2]|uniref:acyl-CoA carboxylase epsilon subunit n=1 Tax=Actinotalea sp. K2 TaxID=2939438 RepID=UPI002017DF83|nr:acyl-CoA carboxylase epsilon subunit [Actinotalea sp. K2]MCL3862430.1 acyl-CoA carboxylase subunit epsilon [Actinotalea sp. K2]